MSRNYKFHNPEGLYFVSFAVVELLDLPAGRQVCSPEMSIKTYMLKVCLIVKVTKEWKFLPGV